MDREALEGIASRVRACTKCRLAEGRIHAVPGEGGGVYGHEGLEVFGLDLGQSRASATSAAQKTAAPFSGVMLVGEAPGRNEDETGRPFCGAAGKNLDLGLAAAGLERQSVFITSINKCRPPKNRDPRPDEKAACRPYLLEQIDALAPSAIVALGRHGLSGLVEAPPSPFGDVRGRFVDGPRGAHGRPLPLFCSLHPAAIIYRQAWKEAYLEDWRRLGAWLRGQDVEGFPPLHLVD